MRSRNLLKVRGNAPSMGYLVPTASSTHTRMITGLGIGGELTAVNSAIDELKHRGRIDLIVNGSFWLGAADGALASPLR
jgi:hypothetical protein